MIADNAIRLREQVSPGRRRAFANPCRRLAGLALILLGAAIAPAAAQQPTAQSVVTFYAERQPIARTLTFVGRVEARERVIVQARVKGFLEAVLFKEGDFVRKGDKLYQIEKGLFQAAVD